MSACGNAAPRGMTATNRIRLTSPFAETRRPRPGEHLAGPVSYWAGQSDNKTVCADPLPPPACLLYHRIMLRVKKLESGARLPVVAHPGEDLGYDVFALEGAVLAARATVKLRTGIAVEARHPETGAPLGLLVRDRSSMAARGLATTGGVIDAGYRGEVLIVMTNLGEAPVELQAGEKIAQMVPVPVLTGPVAEADSLEESYRAAKGFGSSGK